MSYGRLCSSSLDILFDGKFLTAIWHRRFMFWLTSWNFNSPTARYFSASSCGMPTISQEVCFEPYLQRNPFVMKELKSSCFTKPSKCSLLPASSHPPSSPILPPFVLFMWEAVTSFNVCIGPGNICQVLYIASWGVRSPVCPFKTLLIFMSILLFLLLIMVWKGANFDKADDYLGYPLWCINALLYS